MPLDLREIALDPDLAEEFVIIRTTGQFGIGGWQHSEPLKIQAFGIIGLPEPQDIEQVPEGDRVTGMIQVVCAQPIYETLAKNAAIGDQIVWQGDLYRVIKTWPWKGQNVWIAMLVRLKGT